jgi:lipopolysaccharide export LptBFGC system permease protein LptF
MPESRNRPGHPYKKPADIPASQRVKGKIIWALLFGVFGLLISYFAAGANYKIIIIATIVAAIIGYFIGKKMEKKS